MFVTTKICTQCCIEQPINCFYRNKGTTDGRLHRCVTCQRMAVDSRPRARKEDREPSDDMSAYRSAVEREDARAKLMNEAAFARLRTHREEARSCR